MVSTAGDPHVERVAQQVRAQGVEPIELDTGLWPNAATAGARIGANLPLTARLRTADGTLDVVAEEVGAVWWRRPGAYYGLTSDISEEDREFVRGELDQTIGAFWAALAPETRWVSHPHRIRSASQKLEQLDRARRMGMAVPETLVTMDPDELRYFWEQSGGEVVFKVQSDTFLGALAVAVKHPMRYPEAELRQTLATRVTEEMLVEADTVRASPSLFQRLVPKAAEYRVIVIGDHVVAARIDAASVAPEVVDWRQVANTGVELPMSAARLPDHVERFVRQFVASYGLDYSAMDLIETPEGDWVFLENNPNGQFLFVEDAVPELRLAELMASHLIGGTVR
jgi:glutathione synthase/RimK-type ligase-like ATP-grasp enzyme